MATFRCSQVQAFIETNTQSITHEVPSLLIRLMVDLFRHADAVALGSKVINFNIKALTGVAYCDPLSLQQPPILS